MIKKAESRLVHTGKDGKILTKVGIVECLAGASEEAKRGFEKPKTTEFEAKKLTRRPY